MNERRAWWRMSRASRAACAARAVASAVTIAGALAGHVTNREEEALTSSGM